MRTIVITTLFLFFSANLAAQELEENKVYPAGATVKSKVMGIALKVPKGFKGGVSGEYFVMGKEGLNGLLAVTAEKATYEEAKAFISTPQQLDGGYVFAPSGKPTEKGDTLTVDCVIAQGLEKMNGQFTIRVGKFGLAVGVIAAGEDKVLPGLKKAAQSVTKSLKFSKPFVPTPGKSTGKYVKEVSGKVLNLFSTASDFTSRTKLTMCPNGTFARNREASGGSGPADLTQFSYASQSDYYGKYSIVGDKLHLYYNDGDKAVFTLSFNKEGHFLMNGTRWLREGANCQ